MFMHQISLYFMWDLIFLLQMVICSLVPKHHINFICLLFQGGGIPRRSAPVLQLIREEVCLSILHLFTNQF